MVEVEKVVEGRKNASKRQKLHDDEGEMNFSEEDDDDNGDGVKLRVPGTAGEEEEEVGEQQRVYLTAATTRATVVGSTLFTKFTDGNYRGVVTSVNHKNETGEALFHVQYDDGDEDDMTWAEIQEHVVVVVGSDVEEEDSSEDEDSSDEMEEDSSDESSDDDSGEELVEDSSEDEDERGKGSVLRRVHVAGMGRGRRSRMKRETGTRCLLLGTHATRFLIPSPTFFFIFFTIFHRNSVVSSFFFFFFFFFLSFF